MGLGQFEKITLLRNFRTALTEQISSRFDQSHLSDLHSKLCEGLESRDAQFRSGEIKADPTSLKRFSLEVNRIAENMIGSASKKYVAENAAKVLTAIENIKPFHTLNSMVAKLYTNNLAQTSGLKIDWSKIEREQLKAAIDEARGGNKEALSITILENLKPMYEPKSSAKVSNAENFKERAENFKNSIGSQNETNGRMKAGQIN